jgi:polysaccharide export outer membrane protein
MDTRPTHLRRHATLLAGLIALAGGCYHTKEMVISPPPDGSVPTEGSKVILPRYVIEAPDVLLVQVLLPPAQYLKEPRGAEDTPRTLPQGGATPGTQPGTGTSPPAGGASQGTTGATPGATGTTQSGTSTPPPPEDPLRYFSAALTPSPIDGQHLVQMDGSIDLGIYGSVVVAGLDIDQARERVRAFIAQQTNRKPNEIQVRVSVVAFNSKPYYIITDGAGNGVQVTPLPITGSETVLDAFGRIGGLPPVSSKRDIWIARRSPHGGPDQLLPVCWEEITEEGIMRTNYQVLPGDRIYVKAQKLITFDNALAKVLQPIERILGVTLLGSETVNSIRNRNGTSGTGG